MHQILMSVCFKIPPHSNNMKWEQTELSLELKQVQQSTQGATTIDSFTNRVLIFLSIKWKCLHILTSAALLQIFDCVKQTVTHGATRKFSPCWWRPPPAGPSEGLLVAGEKVLLLWTKTFPVTAPELSVCVQTDCTKLLLLCFRCFCGETGGWLCVMLWYFSFYCRRATELMFCNLYFTS